MNALEKVIAGINAKYKKDVIQQGTGRIYVEKIPFSSPRANYMTYGGVPIGKSTEFFGPEGGGKTTSALDITAQAQKLARQQFDDECQTLQNQISELEEKNNKSDQKKIEKLKKEHSELLERGTRKCVYIDLEHTLDEEWAEKIGVDLDDLKLMRPDEETAEEVLQIVLDLIESGLVILLVIDSVPMLVGQNVYDEDMSKKSYGGVAGVLADFSKRVSPLISKHKTALLSINQIREDLQNPHNQYKTPGGSAWKHFHALRLYFRKGSFINNDNEEVPMRTQDPAGNVVDIHVVKTKVCKPDRRIGQYTIRYDIAIDVLSDTIFMAEKYNMVAKSSAWYSIIDPESGEILKNAQDEKLQFQGRAKLLEYLREDEDLFDEIYEAVNMKLAEVI
jgi:recombination protein RecA